MILEFIEFEGYHFGVLDILPKSLAQQVITQEEASKLAQDYATHFGKAVIVDSVFSDKSASASSDSLRRTPSATHSSLSHNANFSSKALESSALGKKATKISDITTLPPMLTRKNRLLILDDYLWRTDSGGVLYNLGCVFCDLAECQEWDEDKTYAFLKVLYPKKVRANPSAWQDYAKTLVEHTQALKANI